MRGMSISVWYRNRFCLAWLLCLLVCIRHAWSFRASRLIRVCSVFFNFHVPLFFTYFSLCHVTRIIRNSRQWGGLFERYASIQEKGLILWKPIYYVLNTYCPRYKSCSSFRFNISWTDLYSTWISFHFIYLPYYPRDKFPLWANSHVTSGSK